MIYRELSIAVKLLCTGHGMAFRKSTSRSNLTEQARCVRARTVSTHRAACYLSALRPCRAGITLSHGIAGFVCELRPQTAVAERCMFQSVYPHNCPQPDNVAAFEQAWCPRTWAVPHCLGTRMHPVRALLLSPRPGARVPILADRSAVIGRPQRWFPPPFNLKL